MAPARTPPGNRPKREYRRPRRSDPEVIAAVDLGSNSFHMIVARPVHGRLLILDQMREMVQLASGLDANHCLDARTQRRALACLRRFGQRLRDMPAGSVRAVGTNTLRQATNAQRFLQRAEPALGHPIEIVGGQEEARLIYLGVASTVAVDAGRRLVIDVGGGSTECIVGRGLEPLEMESLGVGCVGLSRAYFPQGRISRAAFVEAELAAGLEFQAIEQKFRALGWQTAIGASGTVKAAGELARLLGEKGGITGSGLAAIRERLIHAKSVRRLKNLGLRPERAAVLPGGIAVLMAAFEALGIAHLEVSEGALREGVLYDLLGRMHHDDIRERTITALCEDYRVDQIHARRVEATARGLLAQVAERWGIGAEGALRLGWASRLHELGLAISHSQYHRHGAYVLRHADLPGFSRSDQEWLAALVGAHRRRFPEGGFDSLPDPQQALRLAILLRLAVLLHRARAPGTPTVGLTVTDRSITLAWPKRWLSAHPLTKADLAQEAIYLRAVGIRLRLSR